MRVAPAPDADACRAWLAVSGGLVAGVHHALNNRVASVSALAQILSMGGAPTPQTESALLEETRRLDDTVRLLRLLPRDPGGDPVPLRLPELLPDALALVHHDREAREVRHEVREAPDTLPVVAEETALAHALLMLLVAAGRAARARGSGTVSVRLGGDERWTTLEVEPGGGEEEGGVVAAMFAAVGGEVRTAAGGWEVRMPTLPEVRRRERG